MLENNVFQKAQTKQLGNRTVIKWTKTYLCEQKLDLVQKKVKKVGNKSNLHITWFSPFQNILSNWLQSPPEKQFHCGPYALKVTSVAFFSPFVTSSSLRYHRNAICILSQLNSAATQWWKRPATTIIQLVRVYSLENLCYDYCNRMFIFAAMKPAATPPIPKIESICKAC